MTILEPHRPTIARVMPTELNAGTASRLRTLLKAKQSLPTSNRTSKRPSPPRGAARLAIARSDGRSRLTKDVVGGFFTLNIRIVFGHGCDYPRYVPEFMRHSGVVVNFSLAVTNGCEAVLRDTNLTALGSVSPWPSSRRAFATGPSTQD